MWPQPEPWVHERSQRLGALADIHPLPACAQGRTSWPTFAVRNRERLRPVLGWVRLVIGAGHSWCRLVVNAGCTWCWLVAGAVVLCSRIWLWLVVGAAPVLGLTEQSLSVLVWSGLV